MVTKGLRGNSWEYVVKRKGVLTKPIYLSFSSEAGGDEYVRRLEAQLDASIVPAEFVSSTNAGKSKLVDRIRAYQVALHVPQEDQSLLGVIYARVGATPLL